MMRAIFLLPLVLLSCVAFAAEPDPHAGHDAHAGHQMTAPTVDPHSAHHPAEAVTSLPAHPGHMHGDRPVLFLSLDHFEYRGGEGSIHWEGEGWFGGDSHRLWLRSEGEIEGGEVAEGRHEILHGRPITTYFDLLAGVRYDLDAGPGRGWLALGVEGLAPYFFDVSATLYAGDAGRFAASADASFDLLLTQKLILEPSLGIEFHTRSDRTRLTGSGLSQFESGLRLRYEITRKFAPYVGVQYERAFGATRRIMEFSGEDGEKLQLVAGLRLWF